MNQYTIKKLHTTQVTVAQATNQQKTNDFKPLQEAFFFPDQY